MPCLRAHGDVDRGACDRGADHARFVGPAYQHDAVVIGHANGAVRADLEGAVVVLEILQLQRDQDNAGKFAAGVLRRRLKVSTQLPSERLCTGGPTSDKASRWSR